MLSKSLQELCHHLKLNKPAKESSIAFALKATGARFPADYMAFLRAGNGGRAKAQDPMEGWLNELFPVEKIHAETTDAEAPENVYRIGSDCFGEPYCWDQRGKKAQFVKMNESYRVEARLGGTFEAFLGALVAKAEKEFRKTKAAERKRPTPALSPRLPDRLEPAVPEPQRALLRAPKAGGKADVAGELRHLWGPALEISHMDVSADGRLLLVAFNVAGRPDHELYIWDLEEGGILRRFVNMHAGSHFLVAGGGGIFRNCLDTVAVYDAMTGERRQVFATDDCWIAQCQLMEDERTLVAVQHHPEAKETEYTVSSWDFTTGKKLRDFAKVRENPKITLSASRNQIFVTERSASVTRGYDLKTGAEVAKFDLAEQPVISPDGTLLALHGCIWDAAKGKQVSRIDGSVVFDECKFRAGAPGKISGQLICFDYRSVTFVDVGDGSAIQKLIGAEESAEQIVLSPDTMFAVSTCNKKNPGLIRVWRTPPRSKREKPIPRSVGRLVIPRPPV